MPRGLDGSYSLPSGTLVNSGDTILPSQHNPAMTDIASAMSGSLSRDGLGGMRANLDMGSFKVLNAGAATNPGDLISLGVLNALLPIGTPLPCFTTNPPSANFLFAFGQAISRVTYADLFAAFGTTYGSGDGTTTFNLPDARGRALVGKDDMGGTAAGRLTGFGLTLGGVGGTESVVLTVDQLAAHTHAITDPGHTHTYTRSSGFAPPGPDGNTSSQAGAASTDSAVTGITINSAGTGQAHPNVQPSLVCNWMIRVL